MQHTNGVAVVATQLAGTDRRALSQAWYSALHLAGRAPAAGHAARPPVTCVAANGPRPARAVATAPQRRADDGVRNARLAARDPAARPVGAAGADRRAPKTELAKRIERGLTRRSPHVPTSFAVRGAGGRVHLLVRSDGTLTRVVAVCAPQLRERVERALAQARFALAGCGVRAEVA